VKTLIPKKESVESKWYLIDGNDQVLGRMASQIATLLRGKHKPEFTPHLDLGDHVVVVNADKIRVTGNKTDQKRYTRYTGYPGGLKVQTLGRMLQLKPEKAVKLAVKGMLPKNRLGRQMLRKLRVYAGPEHPHQAQQVEPLPNHLRRI
jgi:large subunit ribosomal protein L13